MAYNGHRQLVLDTETTGLKTTEGHRIIEIGCVELMDRKLTGNHYHQYINPERAVDEGALAVHGISDSFLSDKPVFAEIVDDFLAFTHGAELIIHNAPFDIGFLDHELQQLSYSKRMTDDCTVFDTLKMARDKHPAQKNNLDALCLRYGINNESRTLHGALLDAEILADVYLAMTGGQVSLALKENSASAAHYGQQAGEQPTALAAHNLPVISPTEEELASHQARLLEIDKASNGQCVWLTIEDNDS